MVGLRSSFNSVNLLTGLCSSLCDNGSLTFGGWVKRGAVLHPVFLEMFYGFFVFYTLNFCKITMGKILVISLFYKWGHRDLESVRQKRLDHIPLGSKPPVLCVYLPMHLPVCKVIDSWHYTSLSYPQSHSEHSPRVCGDCVTLFSGTRCVWLLRCRHHHAWVFF